MGCKLYRNINSWTVWLLFRLHQLMGCLTKHIGREQKVIGKLRRGPVWMMAADFWRMAPCLHFCQMAADAATQLLCSRPQRDLGIQQKLTKNAPTPASISKLDKSWSQNQRRDHAGCISTGHRVGTTVSAAVMIETTSLESHWIDLD